MLFRSGREVLENLAEAEERDGLIVVNSSKSLLRMSRGTIVNLFVENALPMPTAQVVSPSVLEQTAVAYPFWIKRADACAQNSGDVCLVCDEEGKRAAIKRFNEQGTPSLVVEQHITGDLVKFYGVEGTDFFSVAYPTGEGGFSKFGLEAANGQPQHFPFSQEEMKRTADRAAQLTGMTVYGGDAIVGEDGQFKIIDFNDWPSFSSCRREAAKAIASRINKM